ncbi:hypothetical protein D3C73_1065780 [compost metagenome]
MAVGGRRIADDFSVGGAAAVPAVTGDPAAAGAAPRCGGQRLAAALFPAANGGDCGGAVDGIDGGQHATVVDPRRYSGAGAAVGRYRLGQPVIAATHYAEESGTATGG